MKKIVKRKNTTLKSVNNHKITNHNFYKCKHNVSKELIDGYLSMAPIYQTLNAEYANVDLVDLEFYERWLNE